MKPLHEMTREEIYSLDRSDAIEAYAESPVSNARAYSFLAGGPTDEKLHEELDTLRIELQHSSAESCCESEELTVDEQKQLKYDYAKANAKINHQV